MTKTARLAATAVAICLLALAAGCMEPAGPQVEEPAVTAAPAATATQPAPKVAFPSGGQGRPGHVVYLIDRSGSMAPLFHQVLLDVLQSIGKLSTDQDFTILCFSNNEYIQGPRKTLVDANAENKLAAHDFLQDIVAVGPTTVLPALKRAFDVLKYADPRREGRLIFIITDGDFEGMSGGSTYTAADGRALRGNEAVIQWLRDNNPEKQGQGRVHIITHLYANQDEAAVKVMKTIAEENGGAFKHLEPDK